MTAEDHLGEQFDYRGRHQPDPTGPPLHDVTQKGNCMEGLDVYENPQHFVGTEHPRETIRQMRSLRGKPEGMATIYRAAPRGVSKINTGDWVTLSHGYAAEHAKHAYDEKQDWPTIKASVPASHVRYAGDDLNEWGYFGPSVAATVHRDPLR